MSMFGVSLGTRSLTNAITFTFAFKHNCKCIMNFFWVSIVLGVTKCEEEKVYIIKIFLVSIVSGSRGVTNEG